MSRVILSCTTMLECVAAAQEKMGTELPVVELDRSYHVEPKDMRRHILQTLESLPPEYDTVLVAMGFCGGSWQDVSCSRTLVLPRVDDCVTLAMTTTEEVCINLKQMGHMYIFGEGRTGFSIDMVYRSLMASHDPETAQRIFDGYFENYYNVDIVDNGLYDCYDEAFVERAQRDADRIGAVLDYIPGSNLLLEKLVSGRWDGQFLIVPPQTNITQGLIFDV